MISYPAIVISKEDSFTVVNGVLDTCTVGAYRGGYFNDQYYYDSSGLIWPVVDATPVNEIGIMDKITNSKIKMKIAFGEPVRNGIDEVKKILLTLIESDPDDLYSQERTNQENILRIRAAPSPKELIDAASHL